MSADMQYDLWDTESGNRIQTCTTATEAVTLVRALLAVNAEGYVDTLACAITRTGAADNRTEWVRTVEGQDILHLDDEP